jgi:hypothetical protein
MKSTLLWVGAAIAAIALLVASPASARGEDKWWTTDRAEALLLDSDFVFNNDIVDATCNGWGTAKLAADGTRSYRRFVCSAISEVESQWCLPGECDTQTITTTCNYKLKLQTINDSDFILSGVRSTCARS